MANTASKVIQIALNEVGYLEKKSNSQLDNKTTNAGSNNYTKYARDLDNISGFYNGKKNGFAWCDVFVDWCFVQAFGVNKAKELLCQPNKSLGAGCYYSMNYYKNNNQFYTKPVAGDQIFFKSGSRIVHTGIVYKVDNTCVYTVEGNTSGASGVVANGGGVCKKKYSLAYGGIAGYGRPKYDVEPTPSAKPSSSTSTVKPMPTNKIDTIKEVQNWANKNYKSGLVVDGEYGIKTKRALIKILQKELNQTYGTKLTVDGVWGNKTKAACPTLKKGSKNDVVGVLQALLICAGYRSVYLDKDYGSATFSTVKSFQKNKGLTVDGVAGKNTFAKLCG